MEVYFSGTLERISFENVSNFFRILLLDIDDTNAEDFDDYEIIVTGTMADIICLKGTNMSTVARYQTVITQQEVFSFWNSEGKASVVINIQGKGLSLMS